MGFIDVAGLGVGVFAFIALVALLLSVFWIIELVDILRREFRDPTMKIVWLVVVFFGHIVGALLYFFIGKQQGILPGQVNRY